MTEIQNHLLKFVTNYENTSFELSLNMKGINVFLPSEKYGSVDVPFTPTRTHQKSVRSLGAVRGVH